MTEIEEFDQILIDKGYCPFKPSPLDSDRIMEKFQRCIRDDIGRKYSITIDKWQPFTHPYTGETYPPGYEYNSYFTFNGYPVLMKFYAGWDIDEAEEKIEELWQKGGFDYYEMDECN